MPNEQMSTLTAGGVTYDVVAKKVVDGCIGSSNLKNSFLMDSLAKKYASGRLETLQESANGYSPQGLCEDDNYYYVGYRAPVGQSNATLVKYDKSTGGIAGTLSGEFYHMNSLAIDTENEIIYSADCISDVSGSAERVDTISVINASTMQYIKKINVTFERDVSGLGYYGGLLYAISSSGYVYSINPSSEECEEVCHLDEEYIYGTPQGGCVDDEYIYFCMSTPNRIIIYNRNGDFVSSLNLQSIIEYCYILDELEDVCIRNGIVYLLSNNYGYGDVPHTAVVVSLSMNNSAVANGKHESRTGIANSIVVADGLNNTSSRLKNGYFKTPMQALGFIKSCPPGTYDIKIEYDSSDNLIFESCSSYIIRLYSTNNTYSGNITLRNGNVIFVGNYDASTLSNSTSSKIYIDCGRATPFFLDIEGSVSGTSSNGYFIRGNLGIGIISIQSEFNGNATSLQNYIADGMMCYEKSSTAKYVYGSKGISMVNSMVISDGFDLSTIPSGIHWYNGYASGSMKNGTVPFSNAYGTWIRKRILSHVMDTVIRQNGSMYISFDKGEWIEK